MSTQPTFATLARESKRTLDRIMRHGIPPPVEETVGWEFRGWNLSATTKVLGTRKFKKGFYRDPQDGSPWGYNVPVEQNAFDEPWRARPSDANPRRYYFFGVLPGSSAHKPKYRESLVVDYRLWKGYAALSPVRYTVDYLVLPDAANRDLLLGKSYWEAGPIRPYLGYFVLERHNRNA